MNIREKNKKEKKILLNYICCIIKPFENELNVKFFQVKDISSAIYWAKTGHVAIHENYASKRKKLFHIISTDEKKIIRFCYKLGISTDKIVKKDLFKFSHINWTPYYEPFDMDKDN